MVDIVTWILLGVIGITAILLFFPNWLDFLWRKKGEGLTQIPIERVYPFLDVIYPNTIETPNGRRGVVQTVTKATLGRGWLITTDEHERPIPFDTLEYGVNWRCDDPFRAVFGGGCVAKTNRDDNGNFYADMEGFGKAKTEFVMTRIRQLETENADLKALLERTNEEMLRQQRREKEHLEELSKQTRQSEEQVEGEVRREDY